ncbi:Alpha/Beta hydrolase protein [Phyllosticta citricarpa]|uniref:Alpha/Beta hydrolase protein n=3 Tax=Phyllosticta TaxID=121621 RepID=A0ABR1LGZ6_9PEZI
MSNLRKVEFKTIDGLLLRGFFFPTANRGPGIVITPGFNCVKEMFVLDVAEHFQRNGINALVYDPRSLGESEGLPRNDIDPVKQVSDYSDALSFLMAQPSVDARRVAFWGMSFSATIALCAASMDKRARLCIAICPLLNFEYTPEKFPKVLLQSMRDRQSQALGNSPLFLPVLMPDGKNPAGLGFQTSADELDYMINAKARGAPNYENQTTLQSYYKLVVWQPHGIMRHMTPTPTMMIIPEKDVISPPEEQLALFDTFPEPKKSLIAPGKGHLNVLSGEEFPLLMNQQVKFLHRIMA